MTTVTEAMRLAVAHHQAGRLAEAEAIYRQVLAAVPGHADALHLLGVANLQRGRHEAAVDHIGRAITLNPGQAAYPGNLGLAYQGLGRLEEAEAAYHRALAIEPKFADARYNLGMVLKARGRIEEAAACYRKTLEIEPDHANASPAGVARPRRPGGLLLRIRGAAAPRAQGDPRQSPGDPGGGGRDPALHGSPRARAPRGGPGQP